MQLPCGRTTQLLKMEFHLNYANRWDMTDIYTYKDGETPKKRARECPSQPGTPLSKTASPPFLPLLQPLSRIPPLPPSPRRPLLQLRCLHAAHLAKQCALKSASPQCTVLLYTPLDVVLSSRRTLTPRCQPLLLTLLPCTTTS